MSGGGRGSPVASPAPAHPFLARAKANKRSPLPVPPPQINPAQHSGTEWLFAAPGAEKNKFLIL